MRERTLRSCLKERAPAKNRLGAIVRRKLPHNVLDVHFDGVFRKIELGGDQLVGKAELQFGEHMLLARREVGNAFRRGILLGAVSIVDCGQLR